MTEERMIINVPDKIHPASMTVSIKMHDENGRPVQMVSFCQFEPAPPKDWQPACFSESKLHDHCNHPYFDHEESCEKCPFKKR